MIAVSAYDRRFFTDRVRGCSLQAPACWEPIRHADSRPCRRRSGIASARGRQAVRFPSMVTISTHRAHRVPRVSPDTAAGKNCESPTTCRYRPARPLDTQTGNGGVDERLHTSLELGQDGRIEIGKSRLKVAAVITHEPGVELGFLSGAPRLVLNAEDLAATGLLQPGSRVGYRLQIAGDSGTVDAYRTWAQSRLRTGQPHRRHP